MKTQPVNRPVANHAVHAQRNRLVADKDGQVAASLRGDGTSPAAIEFTRMKTYTARVRNQTSLEFMAYTATGDNQTLRQIPGMVAIGVSGAPGGDKDEACAKAGIAKITTSLN